MVQSISTTTRAPREGEIDGKDLSNWPMKGPFLNISKSFPTLMAP